MAYTATTGVPSQLLYRWRKALQQEYRYTLSDSVMMAYGAITAIHSQLHTVQQQDPYSQLL